MRWVDPFAALSGELLSIISASHAKKAKARREFEETTEAYREMLEDERYGIIRQRVVTELADELRGLVDDAAAGKSVQARAVRIKFLEAIVSDPIEALWLADQKTLGSNELEG
jgi:hypothetical protein